LYAQVRTLSYLSANNVVVGLQAQSCNPAEYGGKGRHRAGICIKKGEPIISDKLACST